VLLTYDRSFPRLGRVRVYNNFRHARDDIRDNVIEWVVREGSRGDFVPYSDPLPGREAWVNTAYLGYELTTDRARFLNRAKYEFFHQIDYDDRPLEQKNIRETSSFLGLINKAEYTIGLGSVDVQPRWKSEFQRSRPALKEDQQHPATTELAELFSVIVRVPILSRTWLQTGVEYLYVNQFVEELEDDPIRSDRNELVYALQLSNNVAYLGYDLWTQAGMRLARIDRESAADAQTETRLFITMYAGFGE
jgi:hypothetical protein